MKKSEKKRHQEKVEKFQQKREESENFIKLLKSTFEGIREAQIKKHGLVIIEAYYGVFIKFDQKQKISGVDQLEDIEVVNNDDDLIIDEVDIGDENELENLPTENESGDKNNFIDVTIPLQVLVDENSQLIVPAQASFSELSGFYEPFVSVIDPKLPKKLKIVYKYKGKEFNVEYSDGEKIKLPQKKHLAEE